MAAQVVRTRLHTNPVIGRHALLTTVRRIFQEEGGWGFYRGLVTNMLRVVPAAATTLLTYELVLRTLQRSVPIPSAANHLAVPLTSFTEER